LARPVGNSSDRRSARGTGGVGLVRAPFAGALLVGTWLVGTWLVGTGLAGVILFVPACASNESRPVRPEYDLRDPSATRRLVAIAAVEKSGDRTQVPVLIEMLDDDDDSVRMSAGSALKALTGHDTGYRAFGSPEERRAHVVRWRAWWATSNRGAPPVRIAPSPTPAGYTSGSADVRAP